MTGTSSTSQNVSRFHVSRLEVNLQFSQLTLKVSKIPIIVPVNCILVIKDMHKLHSVSILFVCHTPNADIPINFPFLPASLGYIPVSSTPHKTDELYPYLSS